MGGRINPPCLEEQGETIRHAPYDCRPCQLGLHNIISSSST